MVDGNSIESRMFTYLKFGFKILERDQQSKTPSHVVVSNVQVFRILDLNLRLLTKVSYGSIFYGKQLEREA